LAIHAQLGDVERHTPAHRLGLLGDIDPAASAFADALAQLVASERLAHGFVRGVGEIDLDSGTCRFGLCCQQSFGLLVRREQGFETGAQGLPGIRRRARQRVSAEASRGRGRRGLLRWKGGMELVEVTLQIENDVFCVV
jgi:hypothetical protein